MKVAPICGVAETMIECIDRERGDLFIEKVYGDRALRFLYGSHRLSNACRSIISGNSLVSRLYGSLMKSRFSKRQILPFIENYQIDTDEFLDSPSSFQSFNDFFIRKLKPSCRPIDSAKNSLIIPADGRYLFYEKIADFCIKGKRFDLKSFLLDPELSERYREGSMVIARLCPTDYHRFHFPCDCIPSEALQINGCYFSVNPVAIKQNLAIFWENKRALTILESTIFGKILYVEVGATNVGSILQTYLPGKAYAKGEEKGYFSFGGSSIVLLFEKGRVQFCEDLLSATARGLEIKCLLGQKMGTGLG